MFEKSTKPHKKLLYRRTYTFREHLSRESTVAGRITFGRDYLWSRSSHTYCWHVVGAVEEADWSSIREGFERDWDLTASSSTSSSSRDVSPRPRDRGVEDRVTVKRQRCLLRWEIFREIRERLRRRPCLGRSEDDSTCSGGSCADCTIRSGWTSFRTSCNNTASLRCAGVCARSDGACAWRL